MSAVSQGMEEKQKIQEADNLKRLAFFGVCVSTVATLTAIIAVPLLYNYTQYVQSSLQSEVGISLIFRYFEYFQPLETLWCQSVY